MASKWPLLVLTCCCFSYKLLIVRGRLLCLEQMDRNSNRHTKPFPRNTHKNYMRFSSRQYGKQPSDRHWLQSCDDIKMSLDNRLLRSAYNSKIRPFSFKLESSLSYISPLETGCLTNFSCNLFCSLSTKSLGQPTVPGVLGFLPGVKRPWQPGRAITHLSTNIYCWGWRKSIATSLYSLRPWYRANVTVFTFYAVTGHNHLVSRLPVFIAIIQQFETYQTQSIDTIK